jgi:hypothetical protein
MGILAKVRLKTACPKWAMVCVAGFVGAMSWGQDFRLESGGVRFGFGANDSSSDFRQTEAFVDWNLPWHWEPGKDWQLQTKLEVSAGWLGEVAEHGQDSFISSGGPTFVVKHVRFPLQLEGGVSPTVLTREDFRTKDVGTLIQFTSHVGLTCDIASRVRIGYRFQHMSNAGLSRNNPGMNLHMFGLSYLF